MLLKYQIILIRYQVNPIIIQLLKADCILGRGRIRCHLNSTVILLNNYRIDQIPRVQ